MSSWTAADTSESAIPLLNISHGCHTTTMDHGGLVGKDGAQSVAVDCAESAGSSPNPYGSHATINSEDEEALVANQGRLRRLFSFVQLLAFALTFMSSWEVIAM